MGGDEPGQVYPHEGYSSIPWLLPLPRTRPLGQPTNPGLPERSLQDPPWSTTNGARRLGGWEERGNQLQMDHLVWYSAAIASVPQRRAKPPGQFESASPVPLQQRSLGPARGSSEGSRHRSPGPCLLPASAETPSSGQIMAGFALHIPVFLPLSNSASMFANLLLPQPHRPGSRGKGAGGSLPRAHLFFVCLE